MNEITRTIRDLFERAEPRAQRCPGLCGSATALRAQVFDCRSRMSLAEQGHSDCTSIPCASKSVAVGEPACSPRPGPIPVVCCASEGEALWRKRENRVSIVLRHPE